VYNVGIVLSLAIRPHIPRANAQIQPALKGDKMYKKSRSASLAYSYSVAAVAEFLGCTRDCVNLCQMSAIEPNPDLENLHSLSIDERNMIDTAAKSSFSVVKVSYFEFEIGIEKIKVDLYCKHDAEEGLMTQILFAHIVHDNTALGFACFELEGDSIATRNIVAKKTVYVQAESLVFALGHALHHLE
jgi:hypothetical protein